MESHDTTTDEHVIIFVSVNFLKAASARMLLQSFKKTSSAYEFQVSGVDRFLSFITD